MQTGADGVQAAVVTFEYVSVPIDLLQHRNQRLGLRKISLFGEMLNQRHSGGKIGDAAPMREVIAADFFLFLRSVFMEDAGATYYHWIPHSTVYMRGMPKFIIQSRGSKYANRLLPSLGVDTIPTFRAKFAQALQHLSRIFDGRGGMLDVPRLQPRRHRNRQAKAVSAGPRGPPVTRTRGIQGQPRCHRMTYIQRVASTLAPLSIEQDDMATMLREWHYTGNTYDLGEPLEDCELCGHPDIRYQFEIANRHTGHGC